MFGVDKDVLPKHPRSPMPKSSAIKTMMFGLLTYEWHCVMMTMSVVTKLVKLISILNGKYF